METHDYASPQQLIKNNQDVRHVPAKSHIYPEELPAEEDI